MKQVFLTVAVLVCSTSMGCKISATRDRTEFVDRTAMSSRSLTGQPLMLVVEIDEAGGLRLNKIETGTTADPGLLAEKLEAIFADRERSGIDEREVLIDPRIDPETEGFEDVVRTLVTAKASPIRIIRDDP